MKRFVNNPANAQAMFSKYAYRINHLNLAGAFIRGGIRLS